MITLNMIQVPASCDIRLFIIVRAKSTAKLKHQKVETLMTSCQEVLYMPFYAK